MNLIEKFLEYLVLEKKYSNLTIKAYKNDLSSFLVFLEIEYESDKLESVSYNQIREWVVYLAGSNISNRSINRKTSSLKSFYKFLQKIDLIDFNPMVSHKSLKVKKTQQIPFNFNEIQMITLIIKIIHFYF